MPNTIPELNDGDKAFTGVDARRLPTELEPGLVSEALNRTFERTGVSNRPGIAQPTEGQINANTKVFPGTVRAFGRWQDPEGFDCNLWVSDAATTAGGRGRAWRLQDGNAPLEIALNGFDVWGPARLVPCLRGLLLLRQGNARAYFKTADVNGTDHTITLHAAAPFATGDRVRFVSEDGNLASLVTNTDYYVALTSATVLTLRATASGADLAIDEGTVDGHFYLELDNVNPGPYGNGAPPLILQPDVGKTAWQNGFAAAPVVLSFAYNSTSKVYTLANHRLAPGDQVTFLTGTNSSTNNYVGPIDDNHFKLYTSALAALAKDSGALEANASSTGTLQRKGASAMPIAPAREGCWYAQRAVLVNERDTLLVSDPNDPVHFEPFANSITANLGEADPIMAVIPHGPGTLIIVKRLSVLSFLNLEDTADKWQLTEITREWGGTSPLAVVPVGADVWILGRRGVMTMAQTQYGTWRGAAVPESTPMQPYIDQVDWLNAEIACGASWQNKIFFAVPMAGQGSEVGGQRSEVRNNAVLVFSTQTNQWMGIWQGDGLQPVQFARMMLGGVETLAWANADGTLRAFAPEMLDDSGTPIATRLVTRGYDCGQPFQKRFLAGELAVAGWNPLWALKVRRESVYTEEALWSNRAADPAKYITWNQPDYDTTNVNGDFARAEREDYSLVVPPGTELVPGGAQYSQGQYILTIPTDGLWTVIPGANEYALALVGDNIPTFGQGSWTLCAPGTPIVLNVTRAAYRLVLAMTPTFPASSGAVTASVMTSGTGIQLGSGVPVDLHQETVQTFRMREESRFLQLVIETSQGELRVLSSVISAVPGRRAASVKD